MFDPYVTRELTLRDLLTHRSGLARGDLMWYGTDYDRDEILRRVRFLKPTWSVRSHFGYQNIMYLAAGQAVAHVAGKSWDDLVRERIFTPLGMTETNTSTRDLAGKTNVATPHSEVNDTLIVVPWHNIDNIGPAGSINSNVSDMIKWVRFQLAQGSVNGKSLVSASALGETHTAQMIDSPSARTRSSQSVHPSRSVRHGLVPQDYRGRELDQHGGNIDGMSAMVAVMPEEKLGLVILTNANGSPVPTIALYRVIDALLNEPPRDWSGEALEADRQAARAGEGGRAEASRSACGGHEAVVCARPVRGRLQRQHVRRRVRFVSRMACSTCRMAPRSTESSSTGTIDTFRAKWNNRALGQNFVTFALGADGKVKSVDFEGIGTFNRRPDAPDTTRKIALAATDAGKLTGTFVSETPALTIDVTYDGELKLTVPGQPVYTLLADSPTRFRMTGNHVPAGFFVEYEMANGDVKSCQAHPAVAAADVDVRAEALGGRGSLIGASGETPRRSTHQPSYNAPRR